MVVSVAVLSFIDRDALIAVFILPHSNFWFFFFINVTHRYWFLLNSVECSSVLNYILLTSITSNLENTGSLISSSTFKMSAVCIIVVVTLRNEKNPWPLTGTLYVFVCLFFNKSTPIWWQKARCGGRRAEPNISSTEEPKQVVEYLPFAPPRAASCPFHSLKATVRFLCYCVVSIVVFVFHYLTNQTAVVMSFLLYLLIFFSFIFHLLPGPQDAVCGLHDKQASLHLVGHRLNPITTTGKV